MTATLEDLRVYSGPFLRFYLRDFEGASPVDEPADASDVAVVVDLWREAMQPALTNTLASWSESAETPHRVALLGWESLGALALSAAYEQVGGTAPDVVPDEWNDDPVLTRARETRPRDSRYYAVLSAQMWIPAPFDGVLGTGGPVSPTDGATASVERLVLQLLELDLRALRVGSAQVERPPAGAALTEHARFAMRTLTDVARFAADNRLPLLLDG
jgi:hypothetical protein